MDENRHHRWLKVRLLAVFKKCHRLTVTGKLVSQSGHGNTRKEGENLNSTT